MLANWYEGQRPVSVDWLQRLHRRPEIGFEEVETARFVADRLEGFGFEVATGIGGSGVVGTLRGLAGPGRRIAFRAELDALPMQERTALPYRSETPSRFHGCGHDGHAVTALTAAAWLGTHRDFAGEARFIFQPAEELLTGARAMLADGLFERFPCDEVYALHNMPGLPAGHVAVPAGAALASADDIDVTIRGNGAHGAMPHTGEDAVAAAAWFIASVQQAATRVADARDAGVISFGRIAGGTARNILPDAVRIEGTLRASDAALRDRLARLLRDAGQAVEALHGVRADVRVSAVAPVAMNHPEAAAAVRASAARVVGAGRVIGDARGVMASEDFAEFQARVPGAYFFIGQDGRAPHHPEYVFDPEIIPVGAAIFVDLARTRSVAPPPPAFKS